MYRLNQNDQYYLYGQHPPPATGTCGAYPTLAAPPDGNPAFCELGADPRLLDERHVPLQRGHVLPGDPGRDRRVGDREVRELDADRAGDVPPPLVHRLPVLHRLRDERSGGLPGQRSFNTNNSVWAQANCAQHWYEGRPGGPPYDDNHCVDINFVSRRRDQRPAALERRDPRLRQPHVQRQRDHQLAGSRDAREAVPHELRLLEQQPDVRPGGRPEVRRPARRCRRATCR